MSVWIKYCGFCNSTDYSFAIALGIDAVGLICVPDTPRFVSDAELSKLGKMRRGKAKLVLVFQDADSSFVEQRIDLANPDMLQFHGQESAEFAESFNLPYIKATRDSSELHLLYPHQKAFAWMIDDPAFTGIQDELPGDRPIIVASGLDPTNIVERIEQCRPFGVDIARGIQRDDRHKDPLTMIKIEYLVRSQIQ